MKLLLLCVVILGGFQVQGEFMDMKIVEEPSSFGVNYPYGQAAAEQDQPKLKLRVQPANFSGPSHFQRLLGRCFNTEVNSYKYSFCPFANLTQHEKGATWNPYHGVLGVWQEWEIENNTFVAMKLKDGDSCGSELFRSAKVVFQCGNSSKILDVTEPAKCAYLLKMQTPLVCHPASMLVYPTLDVPHRQAWDVLEGQWARAELTEKGYKRRLRKIFETAGLMMTKDMHQSLLEKAKEKTEEKKQDHSKDGEFESLETCKAEFGKLQEEVKRLMGQLGLGNQNQDQLNDLEFDA